jgi:Bifunctional DNA primase/polymerase, N-terminal/Primase C terminal 1 (PriCT-1)
MGTDMKSSNIKAARWYQGKGYSVIPIRDGSKIPRIDSWAEYQQKAADRNQIDQWWGRWPSANIAIVTGGISNLVVVDADVDPEKNKNGIPIVENHLSDSMEIPTQMTPRGGRHYFFKYGEGLTGKADVLPGVDIRTDGNYIIVAPSVGENGKPYKWAGDLHLGNTPPPDMPDSLFNNLKDACAQNPYAGAPPRARKPAYINESIPSIANSGNRGDNKSPRQQPTTIDNNDNISFSKGSRDQTLFHLANCLVKGGMPNDNILEYLRFFSKHCNPPFPEKEARAKIRSALGRSEKRDRNLTQEIRDFIMTTNGNFLTTDVYQMTTMTTREEKKKACAILSRFAKPPNNTIEPVGNRHGCYRRVNDECEGIDFLNAKTETVKLWLPFGLHEKVELMPGNIVVIAGESNAGKTALMLNIVRSNMRKFDTHYFNSEMGSSELRKRLDKFDDIALSDWSFKAWERSSDFSDVIKCGPDKLNVIDFLEIYKEFYEIGGMMADIHRKLKGAIAVVAVQKNKGTDTGLGGFRGLEKPRLYLAMGSGYLKIVKAKNWATEENPNGLQVNFKIVKGCNLIQTKGWHKPIDG